jgi:hypothetical protein
VGKGYGRVNMVKKKCLVLSSCVFILYDLECDLYFGESSMGYEKNVNAVHLLIELLPDDLSMGGLGY